MKNYIFEILDSKYWWGGSSNDGVKMPFGKDSEF